MGISLRYIESTNFIQNTDDITCIDNGKKYKGIKELKLMELELESCVVNSFGRIEKALVLKDCTFNSFNKVIDQQHIKKLHIKNTNVKKIIISNKCKKFITNDCVELKDITVKE